jgi:CRP-like cAMP-binding protein
MNISEYVEGLASTPLFRDFPKEVLEAMLRAGTCRIRSYRKSQVIHIQNDPCEEVDMVLKGKVLAQQIDADGNALNVAVMREREFLGENLVFATRNHYPMTIVAARESTILSIPKGEILRLCQDDPAFTSAFLTAVSDKTGMLTDKISSMALPGIRHRIMAYLEKEIRMQGTRTIHLAETKKEMAENMGVQRTSLSRELNRMKQEGIIDFDIHTITLLKENP